MGYFQVRYVIYELKMFLRLATGLYPAKKILSVDLCYPTFEILCLAVYRHPYNNFVSR